MGATTSGAVQAAGSGGGIRSAIRVLFAAGALAALTLFVLTPLSLREQTLCGLALFLYATLAARRRSRTVALGLVVVSIAVSARYLVWRIGGTLEASFSVDAACGAVLLLAELHAFVMLLLGYLQAVQPARRRPEPLPDDPRNWPTVDVYIPTYNEPLAVVRGTVLAARAMDWPAEKLNVYLLDDGRREEFRAFAAEAGVGYIVRPDNHHAKAGNLNHAMRRTRGEYIAIFDCDHVPARSFLQMTLGWFLREEALAMVQTPHHFYSPDPFERNLRTFRRMPNEGELFYGLIQPNNDLWNAAFFCGSCAVLRRQALEEVGGIAVETVTEDAHTALKMHRLGWHTAYLDLPQAAGLATESLSAHVGQRIRWARGMVQIFRIDNPLFGRGLTLAQRLCYSAAMLHFLSGIPRLIFLVAPLTYLLFDLHILNALPLVALAWGLPHIAHSVLTSARLQGSFRDAFWSEVYETCLAWYIALPTTVALINPKLGKFNVTAKGGKIERAFFERRIAQPYLLLTALNLFGIAAAIYKLQLGVAERDVLLVNTLWTVYNLVILAGTLAVAWEQRQVRESPRVPASLPAMLRLGSGDTLRCRTVDLSRGGACLSVRGTAPARGERLWLTLFSPASELPLPAEVVGCDGDRLRLRFDPLSIEEEASLVAAIFSRADAWTTWREDRTPASPLGALASIARHGAAGVGQSLRALRPARAPELPQPVAAKEAR